MTYEENVNENLFSVRALAYALLLCRSEKEALLVLRHFTKAKSPVTLVAEPDYNPDGVSPHWR